ncbi:MAG: carboxypeptidase-like regulatory domain-containing protein [Siphonobacter sp.]
MKIVVSLFCFLFFFDSFSQSLEIYGSVKNELGEPLFGATISIVNDNNKVIQFKISDKNGTFSLKINDNLKNLTIVVRFLGYAESRVLITNDKKEYVFRLTPQETTIKEVVVKETLKVKHSGDTTTYNVEAFSNKTDRSIGDVLSRIPNITVLDDGKIKYKDREISGLYIHGDDLLEDNYGIGTKSISKEMIKNIEIIERFQPINVLKGKKITDDVAVNLILENENQIKISGLSMLAIGAPLLTDDDISAMMFNKKIKTLITTKYNNTGKSFFAGKFNDVLGDAVVKNPVIPEKYINNNNSFIGSASVLKSFNDSIQVRANVQYNYENSKIYYSLINKNFVSNDTVIYYENQDVLRKSNILTSSLTITQNKSSNYFVNKLSLSFEKDNSTSFLDFNFNPLKQITNNFFNKTSNSFHWIPYTKSVFGYEIKHNFKYQKLPQSLFVSPGVDSSLLNNGIGYKSTFQDVSRKVITSDLSVSFSIKKKQFLQKSILLGSINEFQNFNSILNLEQSNHSTYAYTGDFGNDILWKKNREYLSVGLVIQQPYLKFRFSLPFILQQIYHKQYLYSLTYYTNDFFVNPDLFFQYFLNRKNIITFKYSKNNDFGSITDIYRGGILTSFKEFKMNGNNLQKTTENNMSISYDFNNHVNLLNLSLGVSYKFSKTNSTYSNEYYNTVVKSVLLPYQNHYSTIGYTTSISKYIFPLKAKLEGKFNFSKSSSNQFINNVFSPYVNNWFNSRITCMISPIDYLSISYLGVFSSITSKFNSNDNNIISKKNKFNSITNSCSFILTPNAPFNVTIQTSQQINKSQFNTNFFFADIKFKYLPSKLRTEFEIESSNIFNTKRFEYISITNNQFYQSSYLLRGRLLLFRMSFKF